MPHCAAPAVIVCVYGSRKNIGSSQSTVSQDRSMLDCMQCLLCLCMCVYVRRGSAFILGWSISWQQKCGENITRETFVLCLTRPSCKRWDYFTPAASSDKILPFPFLSVSSHFPGTSLLTLLTGAKVSLSWNCICKSKNHIKWPAEVALWLQMACFLPVPICNPFSSRVATTTRVPSHNFRVNPWADWLKAVHTHDTPTLKFLLRFLALVSGPFCPGNWRFASVLRDCAHTHPPTHKYTHRHTHPKKTNEKTKTKNRTHEC